MRTLALLLRWFTLRHARRSLRRSALLVAVLGLGVAVFIAIRLANRAAVDSFSTFTDSLSGASDYSVRAPAGPLPEAALDEVRRCLGDLPVDLVPVLEVVSAPPAPRGSGPRIGAPSFQIVGLDLLALGNLPSLAGLQETYLRGNAGPGSFWERMSGPSGAWLSAAYGPLPKTLDLVFGEKVVPIPVEGAIPTRPEAPVPSATLAVMSLRTLQAITGRQGQLDHIDLVVEPGADVEGVRSRAGEALQRAAAGRWVIESADARRQTASAMTGAFRFNLSVLSLISLLVGLYLVVEALDGAVIRRRSEVAILRSLGVTEGAVRTAWLTESALLGLAGGVLGVLAGWAAAQVAVRIVGRTVDALYFSTTIHGANLRFHEAVLGILLGVLASLAAGWWPAHVAARTPPAQVLHRTAPPRPGSGLELAAGLSLAAAGAGLAMLPPWRSGGGIRLPVGGFGAAFCWIVGGGLVAGRLLRPVGRLLRRVGWGGAAGVVAAGQLRRASGRLRLVVAALHCAFGMAAGMAILVASFERSVVGWIDHILDADLYATSAAGSATSAHPFLALDTVDRIRTQPGVASVDKVTVIPITLGGRSTLLTGTSLAHVASDYLWVHPPDPHGVDPLGCAFVSESYCDQWDARVGSVVDLPTPSGRRALRIAGVFADYGSERGTIVVDRGALDAWFHEDRPTHLSIGLGPGADPLAVRSDLMRQFPGLAIYTQASIRGEVLRVFRQTFGITYALEFIAVAVAVIGLAIALASAIYDRRDDLTVLRALGFRRRELAWAGAYEAAAVSVVSVVVGTILSVALGWLLIYVINKQSFGWTLGFRIPWLEVAGLSAALIATALAVGGLVGRSGAALAADREE
jgi:putative ABC transport system permease protein